MFSNEITEVISTTDLRLTSVPTLWILLRMHAPTALTADGSMLRGSSALLTEARLNYSPGIWMNISGGRDTEKPDQLPLRTYYHTSLRSTLKIAKISQIYNFVQ